MATPGRRMLAGAVTLAAAVTGTVLVAAPGAQAATGCSVEYAVTSQWPGGFVASVGVTNLGDPVDAWQVTWSFGAGQQVTSAWNATVSQRGAEVTAGSASYNGALATGAGTAFGFQGSWDGSNPVPASFTFNGVACTGAVSGASPTATATATATASTSPATGCPVTGHITYTLSRVTNPTADQAEAYRLITEAMDRAIAVYDCYVPVTKALSVSYDPGVATADGNINGSIRFGAKSTMQQITAMHEISHTLGVGTSASWSTHLSGGIWTGSNATSELRASTGDPAAVLHGDSQHFWPYGLNYTSEVQSSEDLVIHCRIVAALRRDMGL